MNKKAGGIVAVILAALVACGCVAGYCSRNEYGTWFQESDIKKWSWNKDVAPDNAGDMTEEVLSSFTPVLTEGIVFCGEAEQEEGVVSCMANSNGAARAVSTSEYIGGDTTTITLKLTSSILSDDFLETLNVPIKWYLDWTPGTSQWLLDLETLYQDEDDMSSLVAAERFVTITPDATFSRRVTIKKNLPFNQGMQLTAVIEGTGKSASCYIGNLIKPVDNEFDLLVSYTSDFGDDFVIDGRFTCVRDNVTTGILTYGSDKGYLRFYRAELQPCEIFQREIQAKLNFDVEFKTFNLLENSQSCELTVSVSSGIYPDLCFTFKPKTSSGAAVKFEYAQFISNWESLTDSQKAAVKYVWYDYYKNNDELEGFEYVLRADYIYDGNVINSGMFCQDDYGFVTGEREGSKIDISGELLDGIVF